MAKFRIVSGDLTSPETTTTTGLNLEAGVYAQNAKSTACFLHAGYVEQYRVSKKYCHIDSFEEVIFLAVINPLFDSSLLK